jgi:tetratricopeptide (TPR) repeat protein
VWLPALLAPAAWVLLYLPSLDHPFVWEDEAALGAGTLLRPAGETWAAFREPLHRLGPRGRAALQDYYRPLPVALLSLVDQQRGREPRAFRVVSLAVGALCVGAFGAFAGWLLGRAGPALFAALFVALHPVAIETTVWIAGMPETLCMFFVVAALASALRSSGARTMGRAAAWATLSLAALGLGLLSKERAAVEPALLVAALVSLGAARRRTAAALVLAHGALVAAYLALLRPAVLGSAFVSLPPIGGSAFTQVLTALASWPGQLGWLFAPLRSSTSDAVRMATSFTDPWGLAGAILSLGSVVAWWALWRSGAAVAALGLAWIWIAFAPTAGLLPMLHASGERYLFPSAFGAALLVAGAGARWLPSQGPAWRRVLVAAAALLALLGLAGRTRARLPDWRSTRALFEADLAGDPRYREAYFVLAVKALEEGRPADAEARLAPLLENDPRFAGSASYLNWLSVSDLACRTKLASGDFEGILALEERWRRGFAALAEAPAFRLCVGQAAEALGQPERAVEAYLAVAATLGDATPPALYLILARHFAAHGRPAQARSWLARAQRFGGRDPAIARDAAQIAAYLDAQRRGGEARP